MTTIDDAGKELIDDEDLDALELAGYNPDIMTAQELGEALDNLKIELDDRLGDFVEIKEDEGGGVCYE